MELYVKCCDVNVNFLIGNALNTWLVSLGMSSPKTIIKIIGLRHVKMGIFYYLQRYQKGIFANNKKKTLLNNLEKGVLLK